MRSATASPSEEVKNQPSRMQTTVHNGDESGSAAPLSNTGELVLYQVGHNTSMRFMVQ
jgi:hypothetical protein